MTFEFVKSTDNVGQEIHVLMGSVDDYRNEVYLNAEKYNLMLLDMDLLFG